jgi:dTDP-4-amino-4,6-dideoxy-D-galactose acyltransferase
MENSRKKIFNRYSQYSVDRKISKEKIIEHLNKELSAKQLFSYNENKNDIRIYYHKNNWETAFFMVDSIIIDYIDFDNVELKEVINSLKSFINHLKKEIGDNFIVTSEVPSEDRDIIQILNNCKFRTLETRLHYCNNNLSEFNYQRYNVRDAVLKDIPNLKRVASFMRNEYDRFHSDWSFENSKADEYLETYIENSINGFTDIVLVPDDLELNSDSFLTANFCKMDWPEIDYQISKMVLSAVSSETNRGWYIRLISEMTYRLINEGAQSIYMNTQSTNFAVIHTWEKLGYKLGRVTHVISLNSND